MKKIGFCVFFLLSTAISAFSTTISNYQEMVSAMHSGERFVILIDISECTNQPKMPIGYLVPCKMMWVPATNKDLERITTSDLHFTDYIGSPLYEYTKCTFNADESVMIRHVLYDPITFNQIGDEHVINCRFGKGIKIYTSIEK